MLHRVLAVLLISFPLVAGANELLNKNLEWKQTPFGERGVYQLSTSFNYQSTWGVTDRHDITTTTNSGSVSLSNGFLSVKSGATSGSTAELKTVEFGRYHPGRIAESGIAIIPKNVTTGSGVVAQWGMYTDDNGAYWRLKDADSDGSLELCTIYETGGTENETCGTANFNGNDKPAGFDPASDGAIYIARMNWYGIGGVEYFAYYSDAESPGTLDEWLIHRHAPANGQSFEDPNLPMVVEVDNGTTTDDIEIEVGGRRYDIQGKTNSESRRSGEFRASQTVASADGLVPMICVRRKSEFPAAGRTNTVTVYASGYDVESDQELSVYYVFDPNVSGGSWTTATHKVSSETAVEVNNGVTSLSTQDVVSGPFGVGTTGTGSNETGVDQSDKANRVHLPGTDPVCLAADVLGASDATVSSWLRVVEEW